MMRRDGELHREPELTPPALDAISSEVTEYLSLYINRPIRNRDNPAGDGMHGDH